MTLKSVKDLRKMLQEGKTYECRQFTVIPSEKRHGEDYRIWFNQRVWVPMYQTLHAQIGLQGYDIDGFANAGHGQGWTDCQPIAIQGQADWYLNAYVAKHDGTDKLGQGVWIVPDDAKSAVAIDRINAILLGLAFNVGVKQFSTFKETIARVPK